jgi:plasmid stabilization system protein ParE
MALDPYSSQGGEDAGDRHGLANGREVSRGFATGCAARRFGSRFDRCLRRTETMPRGDKSAYTDKQKRQAEHIEEGYEHRGVSEHEAERRAWATVNKETGGGKKSGSGRGKSENHAPSRKGGRLGGTVSASRPAAARSASGKKAAATRKRKAAHG